MLMCKKLSRIWSDLDVTVKVNKRELVLGVAACTLAGVLTGMMCSPRKTITVGSNNGGNVIDKRTVAEETEDAKTEK